MSDYSDNTDLEDDDQDNDMNKEIDPESDQDTDLENPEINAIKTGNKGKVMHDNKNCIKYTSDGLSESDYRKSDVRNDKLVQGECCHVYYTAAGYVHQTQYNLGIKGMNVCIHCFFAFNIDKFTACKDLTENEEACLRHYIDNFTKQHKIKECTRIKHYNKCLLCEAGLNILPPIYRPKEPEQYNYDANQPIPDNNNNNNNITVIGKSTASEYVLVL
jgi:hypothetical protein